MDFFISKLAPVFVYPLGAALAFLVLVFVLLLLGYRRLGLTFLGLAFFGLWIASMPLTANLLTSSLEMRFPPVALDELPTADVAILLGGMISPPSPPIEAADLSDPIDRAVEAARLHRAGKARSILVTGGNMPWQQGRPPEAIFVADFLVELGVPREAIVTEAESRNTRENAVNSRAVLDERKWTTALLVTSAQHMPRSVATFAAVGIDATPVPTDFHTRQPLFESVFDLLPDAGALAGTTSAIKEYIGLATYRVRGWA